MDEAQLLQKACEGNTDACTKLLESYMGLIFHIAYGICPHKADADDIVQNVCFKVYSKISSFRQQSSFKTWVGRIAHNEALRWIRDRKGETILPDHYDAPDEDSVSDHTDQVYKQEIVTNLVDALPSRERELLHLFYFEQLSIAEIAEVTDLSQSNIKVTLHRTKKHLSSKLEAHGITL